MYLAWDAKKSEKLFSEFFTSRARWPTFPLLDADPPIDCEWEIEIRLRERWLPRLEGGKDGDGKVR